MCKPLISWNSINWLYADRKDQIFWAFR